VDDALLAADRAGPPPARGALPAKRLAVIRSRLDGDSPWLLTRAANRDVRQSSPIDGKCHHPVPGRESVHPLAQGMDGAADLHPREDS
jgi:hypothetical protein